MRQQSGLLSSSVSTIRVWTTTRLSASRLLRIWNGCAPTVTASALCYLPHDGAAVDHLTAERFEDHIKAAGFEPKS
jgi:hypothetical protein